MTVREPRTLPSQPKLRLRLLLVLWVTFGLLGMHALGAAAALPSAGATEHMSHHVVAAPTGPQYPCFDDDQGTTRHAGHADQMCESAALPGSPGIATPDTAPLTSMPTGRADAQAALSLAVAYEPAGGRAPPLLAELELLRT
ncbi:DUF6153 family protein [Streptomyces sp. NBC_01343]|uniref:DUF6153 family protein n=1 Tax=Streptomyces sp. NBC_01343 TaxID=2903832 RepID=UPI002E157840|nr:DUF6153 family protein [Streptomyces sp. NBC_01343]